MPPAAHMATAPTVASVRSSSLSIVTIMRAPVQPIGWPSEQPEPFTFTRSGSRPRVCTAATVTDAKASLISHESTSEIDTPALARALGMAIDGAMPVSAGLSDAEAQPRMRASGVSPWAAAYSLDTSTSAAAASLSPEELPAVVVAPSSSGFSSGSDASFSSVEVRRGCSSTSNCEPSGRATGTISFLNRPSSMARTAFMWER